MATAPEIDGYSDLVRVSRGGFSVVYRAYQDRFARLVAVKVLDEVEFDARTQKRFEIECYAMGSLSWHPCVVAVYDSGTTGDGQPFLTMEFLDSGSFADRLGDGPLPWTEAVVAGVQVVGALGAAHAAGTLHRDLKPENLLVGPFGEAMLSDFGIAAVEGASRTTTGRNTFTVAHVAPEVLTGKRPDERSDLYGLGSTLHTLIAGAPPLAGDPEEPIGALINSVLTTPAPRLGGVPAALADLLERSLSKDPAERPASAEEFGRALQGVQVENGQTVTELRLSRVSRSAKPRVDFSDGMGAVDVDLRPTIDGQSESSRGDPRPTVDLNEPVPPPGDPRPTLRLRAAPSPLLDPPIVVELRDPEVPPSGAGNRHPGAPHEESRRVRVVRDSSEPRRTRGVHCKAVGIDLGTTKSVVSVLEAGEPVVIPNAEGSRTTPSVVAFAKNGEVLVGEVAKRQAITNPDRTIRSVKRHMGTSWKIDIDGTNYGALALSARVLQKLKADAEAYLGDRVTLAVITVPAYFDDAQRSVIRQAARIAGLEVLGIISEPVAAALAYGFDTEGEYRTIAVLDLGGGNLSVSVLEIGDGVFEVKATHGDTSLGGDDWDQRVIDWLTESFKGDHGVDLSKDNMAIQRLKEAAEKAKIELSSVQQTQINLPFITATDAGPLHLDYNLTRAKFQELTADLLERVKTPFDQAIKDAGLAKDQIDHVILVGGSTRMPAVVDLVSSYTGKEPNKGVNPDEVVAVGAAIQAGIRMGDVKDVLLLDVTPRSLGIETKGGVMTRLIERNTTIPTRRTEVFTTADDMQPSVEIHVLQGEREMAQDNKTLGKFQLVDLPPAPRGVPQIEVTFDIDANGIVHVVARDRATSTEQSITVASAYPADTFVLGAKTRGGALVAVEDLPDRGEPEGGGDPGNLHPGRPHEETARTRVDTGGRRPSTDEPQHGRPRVGQEARNRLSPEQEGKGLFRIRLGRRKPGETDGTQSEPSLASTDRVGFIIPFKAVVALEVAVVVTIVIAVALRISG